MFVDRRKFMTLAAATLAAPSAFAAARPIKAVAFDGFSSSIPVRFSRRSTSCFPKRGASSRRMADADVRVYVAAHGRGHYADFWQVTRDSLVVAAKAAKST